MVVCSNSTNVAGIQGRSGRLGYKSLSLGALIVSFCFQYEDGHLHRITFPKLDVFCLQENAAILHYLWNLGTIS